MDGSNPPVWSGVILDWTGSSSGGYARGHKAFHGDSGGTALRRVLWAAIGGGNSTEFGGLRVSLEIEG